MSRHARALLLPAGLLAIVFWLRWPSLGFRQWNLDEAIHATIARTLLDGGVLYRDAVDQRAPLSYYAEALVFAVAGENNLWAMRAFVAALIAGTAWSLFLAARALGRPVGGVAAAALYAVLTTTLLAPGDAFASNPEWFVAFFSAAATAVFLGDRRPAPRRAAAVGALFGLAFLSKQPALLELAAPLAVLAWRRFRRTLTNRETIQLTAALLGGWLVPVLATVAYFAAHGALGDAVFFSWTYNLRYYGPEISTAERAAALLIPFRLLLAGPQVVLLALWLAGAAVLRHRLAQRVPTPEEEAGNPAAVYVLTWSIATLAGSASSGRDFQHYVAQFLPAFCLGAGLALGRVATLGFGPGRPGWQRTGAVLIALVASAALVATIRGQRHRSLPDDPSVRVAAYVREHSAPDDRIFVWGFHPDIYLESGRKMASRFPYCSFHTGLVAWTNVAPDRDTTYAMIPGAIAALVGELEKAPPLFIVDCSAGPNRHWQKYPPEKYPALQAFLHARYRVEEADQFVPQGFRLYRRLAPGEAPAAAPEKELPPAEAARLALATLGPPLRPVSARAPHGADFSMVDGRAEYFAHAPSELVYEVPAGATHLRGGFGVRPAAYAPENRGPTDGAGFIVRWRDASGHEQVLFRRLLRPREEAGDRGVQSLRVALPGNGPGRLTLEITAGPTGNPASDWTFWTDLTLENAANPERTRP
jgi:hypothetical protein